MSGIVKITGSNIVSILHGDLDIKKPFASTIYLVDAHIAGTTHIKNMEELEPRLTPGTKLRFFREPDNAYDPLAIAVQDEQGNKLGYIPRGKNEILSRLMDGGKLLYGTVYGKETLGTWVRITIQVFLED